MAHSIPPLRYVKDAEIFAPGKACNGESVADFEVPLAAASSTFIGGKLVVCGGVEDRYFDCKNTPYGGQTCAGNTQCVKTEGDAQWCTGPKTKKCRTLENVEGAKKWYICENIALVDILFRVDKFELKVERAYAASVILPDGRWWILGGVGVSGLRRSTEIVSYNRDTEEFKVVSGSSMPEERFGHCATLTPDGQHVLVVGGYGKENYVANGSLYNIQTRSWISQEYLNPGYGSGMDVACGTVKKWLSFDEKL